jgi:phenylalanyl-tRNA synthetase alpha chain
MVELRAQERQVLAALEKLKGKASVEQLMHEAKLSDAAVMRSALTLQEKNLITIHAEPQRMIKLNAEGKNYAIYGLPERRTIEALFRKDTRELSIPEIPKEAAIPPGAIPVTLNWLYQKQWATIDKKENTIKAKTCEKPEIGKDEKLLISLKDKKEISPEQFSLGLQSILDSLKKRQLFDEKTRIVRCIEITEKGKTASKKERSQIDLITQLTPELIITGKWKIIKLQKYNIKAPVAKTWPGKKHPYLAFLDEVREKLVELGFKEMTGTNVETSFFNFDALYTPQDHPAREASGIYFVKQPEYGDTTKYRTIVENVKQTHENGWKTGSTGWKYTYSKQEAKRLILRGHGTCLSARTLLSKDLQIPSKHFSIARVYRPEVIDKTHLSEFNQVEGIVVDEKLTLKDLLGVLEKFAKEIAGADKVRFKPDYFPFTEPSVELNAYKEGYGWVEFGGSGIFRPEVTLPLGVEVPVIAWGLGVDRLFMMKAGIDDIRSIFSQDLDWLRRKQVI